MFIHFQRIFAVSLFVFTVIFLFNTVRDSAALTRLSAKTNKKLLILKGRQIIFQSGCYTCHSFIKGKRYDGVISLADWGDKHLTLKETEKAIRNCKADIYCSQILTNKQVKYVAYYLNSLKNKIN
jgi:hypothetical protein